MTVACAFGIAASPSQPSRSRAPLRSRHTPPQMMTFPPFGLTV